jgi:LacI family transcriptional regulator
MNLVTMKDVGRALGISAMTVSRAMRGHPDIAAETRKRIQAKAKELNYRPNLAARSLVTGRSSLIGLIIPTLLHPFFLEVADALSLVLKKSGYYVIIASSEEDPALEEREIEQIMAHRLDGFIVASCSHNPMKFRQLQEQQIPFVLIDRCFTDFRANYVGVDDRAVGLMATEHLISMGCKHIAHIRGTELSTGALRFEGYKLALLKHGLRFDPGLVKSAVMADVDVLRHGADAMRSLLAGRRPDGVFCYNDPIAIRAMSIVLEAGLRIPKDIAFVGCGNIVPNAIPKIPLSSIDQNSGLIGARAAKLLLRLLQHDNSAKSRHVVLPASLVVRDSSNRLRKVR